MADSIQLFSSDSHKLSYWFLYSQRDLPFRDRADPTLSLAENSILNSVNASGVEKKEAF